MLSNIVRSSSILAWGYMPRVMLSFISGRIDRTRMKLTTLTESGQIFGCSIKQMKFDVGQHLQTNLGESQFEFWNLKENKHNHRDVMTNDGYEH